MALSPPLYIAKHNFLVHLDNNKRINAEEIRHFEPHYRLTPLEKSKMTVSKIRSLGK